MGRQEEALRLAEDLLGDIELQRLKASEVVLKASRLARLTGREDLAAFLALERNGYPRDGSARAWIGPAGRWSSRDEDKFYWGSIASIEATVTAAQDAIAALRGGGNFSGDSIVTAGREHGNRIGQYASNISTFSGITGQVVATVYDMVAEIYHELLFSELQASLFADTQTRVDGSLAAASGSALDKIERVSDRLRDGDPESVSQALTTCRRLIDSCADHVFPAREEPRSARRPLWPSGRRTGSTACRRTPTSARSPRAAGTVCAGRWLTSTAAARRAPTRRLRSMKRGSSSSRPTSPLARF